MLEMKWLFGRRSAEKSSLPPREDSGAAAGSGLWAVEPDSGPHPAPVRRNDPNLHAKSKDSWPRVVVLDGIYYLQFTRDRIVPFLQHGEPLRTLGKGWNFHALFAGFAPVLLFELKHDDGQRATWFFDSVPKFLGHSVDGVGQQYRSILVRKATALLESLLSSFLGLDPAIGNPSIGGFFGISEIARLQISAACSNAVLPPPDYLLLTEFPETLMALPQGDGGPVAVVSRDSIASALTHDFQSRLTKALGDGYLSWPGMVDGTPLPVSAGLCFGHFAFAYRVEEPYSGLVYFVLASEHNARLLGLYMPSEGLVVSADTWSRASVMAAFPAINTLFLNNICQFGDTLLRCFERPGPKRVIASLRESHLGHQLWNELSGLEALVLNVPRGDLPEVTMLGGRATGCFGPLDQIFPEFTGRIRDELQSERAIIEYANTNGLILARFTRMRVTASLRGRILRHLQQTDDFQAAAGSRRRRPGPAVLIGLRVENRTVVGLAAFIGSLVRHIADMAPGCTIVLDGQNRREDAQPLGSFSDGLAARSPLDVERELCQAVIAGAAGYDVAVVTTTGGTIASSIGWTQSVDCFIAIWGAGLAKYRWIGNKPGLILSSHYHLLNPAEMSIYHTPSTMEAPTAVFYADPACAVDDPAAVQLIPVDGPRHISFRVDEPLFFRQVTIFLREFMNRAPAV